MAFLQCPEMINLRRWWSPLWTARIRCGWSWSGWQSSSSAHPSYLWWPFASLSCPCWSSGVSIPFLSRPSEHGKTSWMLLPQKKGENTQKCAINPSGIETTFFQPKPIVDLRWSLLCWRFTSHSLSLSQQQSFF